MSLGIILSVLFTMQTLSIGNDTILPNYLQDIDIVAEKNISPLKSVDARTLKLDMEYMHYLPKILGEANPLHYTQMLPGIQTNSEYDAGVHIYGNESSHNIISLGGVPVYNPSHLLGFFSVFNSTHFNQMAITKSAAAGDGYSCIGGIIDMELKEDIPSKVKGDFALGLMSSQGTLQIPIGKKAAIFTSLRLSYINLIYGSLLKFEDSQLTYSFGDVNLTYLQKINDNQTLHFNFYTGADFAGYKSSDADLEIFSNLECDLGTEWGNMLASAHWNYRYKDGNINQTLYFSGYGNDLYMRGAYNFELPSDIYDFGYRAEGAYKNLKCGISLINHNITPQTPSYGNDGFITKNEVYKQRLLEASLYARYSGTLFRNFKYDIALKGDVYTDFKGYSYQALNPYVKLGYESTLFGDIEFSYSNQHQYLLNCGFTALGLPVEFWIGADDRHKPQISHSFQMAYRRELFNGKYDITLEAYYKKLYNQVEYNGSPLDFLNKQYSLDNIIMCGDGYNYGVNVMINKLTGKLTGWVAYSFGRALRRFEIYGDKWFPSNFERIHEVNVVAAYEINDRFNVGGTFSYASGTPFTSVKHFYLINGNILTEFGEHNANRLKDYIRLDISANYDFVKKNGQTAGVNLSIYNVLCRQNEIYFGLKFKENTFKFQGVTFVTSILPSLSLYYKF